jgi:hypothetical protein
MRTEVKKNSVPLVFLSVFVSNYHSGAFNENQGELRAQFSNDCTWKMQFYCSGFPFIFTERSLDVKYDLVFNRDCRFMNDTRREIFAFNFFF